MNVLIIAATEGEIAPFMAHSAENRQIDVLITGVGMLATAYSLTKQLQSKKYDFVVQAGIGGSYDRSIALGQLIFVTSDRHGDLGAEDHDDYLDFFDIGLIDKNAPPYSNGLLLTPLQPIHDKIALPRANGLTVNTVSGSERTIKLRSEKYGCQVESMEGAAFHYVCLQENIPFAQVRAISNYVIPRDKSQWKMKEAIINLNNWLIDFIEKL